MQSCPSPCLGVKADHETLGGGEATKKLIRGLKLTLLHSSRLSMQPLCSHVLKSCLSHMLLTSECQESALRWQTQLESGYTRMKGGPCVVGCSGVRPLWQSVLLDYMGWIFMR